MTFIDLFFSNLIILCHFKPKCFILITKSLLNIKLGRATGELARQGNKGGSCNLELQGVGQAGQGYRGASWAGLQGLAVLASGCLPRARDLPAYQDGGRGQESQFYIPCFYGGKYSYNFRVPC